MHTEVCSETLKERDRTEDLRADGTIILKWKKLDDRAWTGITWFRKGEKLWVVVINSNEQYCFCKTREGLDLRSNYQKFLHGGSKRRSELETGLSGKWKIYLGIHHRFCPICKCNQRHELS